MVASSLPKVQYPYPEGICGAELSASHCRISGNVDSLARALVMVSRQIRENPPKEKPGGAPPQLGALLAGGAPARYGAPPPAYGAPVAAGAGYR